MTRILFICHGNICRSPMAEFVMKDLVKKAGLESHFQIESAATSTEEIGNPVYPPARRAEADIVAVMLGSNDLLQRPRPSAEVCTERMERFLTTLLEKVPVSCIVLLIAPPPMNAGAWVDDSGTLEESRRLADCYEALARRLGIPFADAGTWNVELTFDGVHFSETGHRAFAEGMGSTLKILFNLQLTDAIDLSR